ncbi:hypothetical protein [Rhizobacter sp. OV335]|uniref:hypothetical protein n=1 Tax=Rhizobacter sp. OV335 TaxID=1500264 RepID=UPI001160F6F2|nr:hypothetical protein [Rhizobacter sp. OV335]
MDNADPREVVATRPGDDMTRWCEAVRRALPAVLFVAALHATAGDDEYKSSDPVVSKMTTPDTFSRMSLSPDSQRLAAIGHGGGHTGLFVLDVQTLEPICWSHRASCMADASCNPIG